MGKARSGSKSTSTSRSTSRGSRRRSSSAGRRDVPSTTSTSLSNPVEAIVTLIAAFISLITTDTNITLSELRDDGRQKMLELARLREINVDEYPIDAEGHVQCPYLIFNADHWTKEMIREAAGSTFQDAFLTTEANGDIVWIANFENTHAVDQVMINSSVGGADHPPRRIPAEDTNLPATLPDLNSMKLKVHPCCGAVRSVLVAVALEVHGVLIGAGAKPHELILSFDSTRMANAFAHMISGWTLGGPPISVKPLVTPELTHRLPTPHLDEPSLKVRSQSDSALFPYARSISRHINSAYPVHRIQTAVDDVRLLIKRESATAREWRDVGRESFTSILRYEGTPVELFMTTLQGEQWSPFVIYNGDRYWDEAMTNVCLPDRIEIITMINEKGARICYLRFESKEEADAYVDRATIKPKRIVQVIENPMLPILSTTRLSLYPILGESIRILEAIGRHMPEIRVEKIDEMKYTYEVSTDSVREAGFVMTMMHNWTISGPPITVSPIEEQVDTRAQAALDRRT